MIKELQLRWNNPDTFLFHIISITIKIPILSFLLFSVQNYSCLSFPQYQGNCIYFRTPRLCSGLLYRQKNLSCVDFQSIPGSYKLKGVGRNTVSSWSHGFSTNGPGNLAKVSRIVKQDQYLKLLNKNTKEFSKKPALGQKELTTMFMPTNSKKH